MKQVYLILVVIVSMLGFDAYDYNMLDGEIS